MRKCHKKNKRFVIILAIICVAILLIVIAIRLETAVRPSAEIQAEQVARHSANKIITETVSDYIAENEYTYGDFANIVYDENGRTSSIEALSGNINRVQ